MSDAEIRMRSVAALLLRPAEEDTEMSGLILGDGVDREFLWLDRPGASERSPDADASWCRRAAVDGEGNVQELTVAEAVSCAGAFLGGRVLAITEHVLDESPALPGRARLIGELVGGQQRLAELVDGVTQVYVDAAAHMIRYRARLG